MAAELQNTMGNFSPMEFWDAWRGVRVEKMPAIRRSFGTYFGNIPTRSYGGN